MKKIVALSFIIATILHIIIFKFFEKEKFQIDQNKIQKINTNLNNTKITLIKLKSQKLKKIKSKKVKLIKNSNKKKLKNNKPMKKKIVNKNKKVKNKKKIIKQPINPKIKKTKKIIKKTLPKLDPLTKSFIDLYGKDFEKFDKITKLFILKNIKDIGLITQRYLEYPILAAQAGQSGLNVVEFILYPNGSISEPKIIKSSGYFMLDDNTAETIKLAYFDYPRPKKPTLIRIFVKYVLK